MGSIVKPLVKGSLDGLYRDMDAGVLSALGALSPVSAGDTIVALQMPNRAMRAKINLKYGFGTIADAGYNWLFKVNDSTIMQLFCADQANGTVAADEIAKLDIPAGAVLKICAGPGRPAAGAFYIASITVQPLEARG